MRVKPPCFKIVCDDFGLIKSHGLGKFASKGGFATLGRPHITQLISNRTPCIRLA